MKTWLVIAVIHTALAVVKSKPAENSGSVNGIRTHDLCDTGVTQDQLSYQANLDLVALWGCNITVIYPICLPGFTFTTAKVGCITAMINHAFKLRSISFPEPTCLLVSTTTPYLGADQMARRLWERDWTTVNYNQLPRNLSAHHFFVISYSFYLTLPPKNYKSFIFPVVLSIILA